MTVKKKTVEEIKTISEKERAILNQAVGRANQAGAALETARESLGQALTLIGDRYGVDLISGQYNIGPEGEIVAVQGDVAEGARQGNQFLTEN